MAKKDDDVMVDQSESKNDSRKVCGIVMPIAKMGEDYPEEHWRRVRKILYRAIERAGMRAQLVWENAEVDVIQSAILQNLYENDVVICDLSGLNPNVMLEAGLRLSTKRPTVVVTDRVQRPPFDISTIGYIDYQKDLEYNAIEDFIDRLVNKLKTVTKAADDGSYQSFVEHFRFETVTPATVSVPADEYLKEQLEALTQAVRRIESRQFPNPPGRVRSRVSSDPKDRTIRVEARVTEEQSSEIEDELDELAGFVISKVTKLGEDWYRFEIPLSATSKMTKEEGYSVVNEVVRRISNGP